MDDSLYPSSVSASNAPCVICESHRATVAIPVVYYEGASFMHKLLQRSLPLPPSSTVSIVIDDGDYDDGDDASVCAITVGTSDCEAGGFANDQSRC